MELHPCKVAAAAALIDFMLLLTTGTRELRTNKSPLHFHCSTLFLGINWLKSWEQCVFNFEMHARRSAAGRRRVLRRGSQQDVQGRLREQAPLRRRLRERGVPGRLLLLGRRRPGPPCLHVHRAMPAAGDDDADDDAADGEKDDDPILIQSSEGNNGDDMESVMHRFRVKQDKSMKNQC